MLTVLSLRVWGGPVWYRSLGYENEGTRLYSLARAGCLQLHKMRLHDRYRLYTDHTVRRRETGFGSDSSPRLLKRLNWDKSSSILLGRFLKKDLCKRV